MIIFLCGFMGSGKTFLLKKLESTHERCLDLDSEVLKVYGEEGDSISQLVSKKGWEYFRGSERELLKNLLFATSKIGKTDQDLTIVALGGGALTEETLPWIKEAESARLVWLETSFATCWERISKDGPLSRPLIEKGVQFLQDLYQQRKLIYAQADFILNEEERGNIDPQRFFNLVMN